LISVPDTRVEYYGPVSLNSTFFRKKSTVKPIFRSRVTRGQCFQYYSVDWNMDGNSLLEKLEYQQPEWKGFDSCPPPHTLLLQKSGLRTQCVWEKVCGV
jgi:hypothetical protein